MTHTTLPDIPYINELEFTYDTIWGAIVAQLTSCTDDTRWQRDPEAIRCHETGRHPSDLYLGVRFYCDDELGCPDGPMRANKHLLHDYVYPQARTALGRMTKRQRKAARKARRAAARKAESRS